MARFDLTDAEFAVIEPPLPTEVRNNERLVGRQILNGIFWRRRTGAPRAEAAQRRVLATAATSFG